MAVPKTQRTGSPNSAKTNLNDGMDRTMHNSKNIDPAPPQTLAGSPDSASSLSSLSCTSSERSNICDNAASSSSSTPSSERSVKFADTVETFLVPSVKDLTVKEKQATFLTDADYRRSALMLERDVDRMLLQQQQQQYASQGRQRQISPKQEDKDTCFLGLDGVTPHGTWIRENLQRSGKEAVTVEQYCQRCKQLQRYHDGVTSTSPFCCVPLNDESVAAAYIPVAMQAQTLAYERAVRNAMEADQFPTTLHQRKHDHPLQYEFILSHIPEL